MSKDAYTILCKRINKLVAERNDLRSQLAHQGKIGAQQFEVQRVEIESLRAERDEYKGMIERGLKYTTLQARHDQLKSKLAAYRYIPVGERKPNNVRNVWVILYAKATGSYSGGIGFYGKDEKGFGWETWGPGILDEVVFWRDIVLPSLPEKGGE